MRMHRAHTGMTGATVTSQDNINANYKYVAESQKDSNYPRLGYLNNNDNANDN